MNYHMLLCAICDMMQITMKQAQDVIAMEQAKGRESYNKFLDCVADWYFNL